MRVVPNAMVNTWRSGEFLGDNRPMARVTVQHPQMELHRVGGNVFASYQLGSGQGTPLELTNVLKVDWSRGVDQDGGECTVELLNTEPLPIGQTPPSSDFDLLGHYTPQRGGTSFSSRWGHTKNQWHKMLLPENLLHVYEGYGFDSEVCPSADPNLVQTGVWTIDKVNFTHDGRIVISCSDLTRPLLQQQVAFPPVVPFRAGPRTDEAPDGKYAYPVQFQAENPDPIINTKSYVNVAEVPLTFDDTSNTPYIGSPNATYHGRRGSQAFDGNPDTYWISVGNARRDQDYAFEWIQGACKSTTVNQVRFRTRGSGYTAYIGIFADGEWKTSPRGGLVPYNPDNPVSAPNFSDENYVTSVPVTSEGTVEVDLPQEYRNVTKVRVTFSNLWYSGLGPFFYRAAVREVSAYTAVKGKTRTVTRFDLRNYGDYTDIVKLFLAWGGFFWLSGAYEVDCDGSQMPRTFSRADKALTLRGSGGRIWGDLKQSGTYGPQTLGIENFEKKPLLDCIRYIRDIIGFHFFIDETGGAIFRPPNIYRVGNWRRQEDRSYSTRISTVPVIDERVVLEDLDSDLDGTNLRERTFVSNTDGTLGHVAAGWNPNPTGLRRVGGWSDQHFETKGEVKIMAELITLRQLFTYRKDSITIRGNPQLQVDDQVRIFERTTNEGFIHRITDIKSSNNLVDGVWQYQCSTHWLGERPFARWAFNPTRLSRETRTYLRELYS